MVRLAAHMRDVNPAVPRHRLRNPRQFARIRIASRRIDQRARHAECAIQHRVAHQRLHLLHLGRRGLALLHALHVLPHRRRAHERSEIQRRPVLFHGAQPAIESMRAVEPRGRSGAPQALHRFQRLLVGWRRRPSLAHDLRRDPLRHVADHAAVTRQQRSLRRSLNIDEPRRHHQAMRIDALLRRRVAQACPRASTRTIRSAANRDVAIEPRIPGAIHHAPAADHQVVRASCAPPVQEKASATTHPAHAVAILIGRLYTPRLPA